MDLNLLIGGKWLAELGFPHYFLRPEGVLYDAIVDQWKHPQKPNEFVLWNLEHSKRTRVNSHHLVSFMFESPRQTYLPNMWSSLHDLGFSNYEVTWDGRIYSLVTCRYLVGNISFDGYPRVCMIDDLHNQRTMIISRLVANIFIPNPENKPEVNHIDGNKFNNCVTNLEWVYGWENVQHALEHNLRKRALSDEMVHKICQYLENGNSVKSIMQELRLPKHAILGIKSGCHARISSQYNIPRNKHF